MLTIVCVSIAIAVFFISLHIIYFRGGENGFGDMLRSILISCLWAGLTFLIMGFVIMCSTGITESNSEVSREEVSRINDVEITLKRKSVEFDGIGKDGEQVRESIKYDRIKFVDNAEIAELAKQTIDQRNGHDQVSGKETNETDEESAGFGNDVFLKTVIKFNPITLQNTATTYAYISRESFHLVAEYATQMIDEKNNDEWSE